MKAVVWTSLFWLAAAVGLLVVGEEALMWRRGPNSSVEELVDYCVHHAEASSEEAIFIRLCGVANWSDSELRHRAFYVLMLAPQMNAGDAIVMSLWLNGDEDASDGFTATEACGLSEKGIQLLQNLLLREDVQWWERVSMGVARIAKSGRSGVEWAFDLAMGSGAGSRRWDMAVDGLKDCLREGSVAADVEAVGRTKGALGRKFMEAVFGW